MLAETLHAHAVYERGAPPPILGCHVPFAAAETEGRRGAAAKAAAAEVFHRRAQHGLHGARTSAAGGAQTSATRGTLQISQVSVPQADKPALPQYPQFGDNLTEIRDVWRHLHRPSMAHAIRRPQCFRGVR